MSLYNRAYLSWYSDGVLVLDISNSCNPVEIARFNPTDAAFEASNGGIHLVLRDVDDRSGDAESPAGDVM